MRAISIAAGLAIVAAAAIGMSGPANAKTRDHYQCYTIAKSTTFAPKEVTLQDQFGQRVVSVVRPVILCAPVKKNAEPVFDPITHFVCYDIQPPFDPPVNVRTKDQFGTLKIEVGPSVLLCVPAKKQVIP
jgi:hypothetical protein